MSDLKTQQQRQIPEWVTKHKVVSLDEVKRAMREPDVTMLNYTAILLGWGGMPGDDFWSG